jgi:hypothetical protein
MGKKKLIMLWELLGNSKQERFKRLMNLIITIAICIMLFQNVRCGYNKKDGKCHDGVWFEWGPVADIKVNVDKKL